MANQSHASQDILRSLHIILEKSKSDTSLTSFNILFEFTIEKQNVTVKKYIFDVFVQVFGVFCVFILHSLCSLFMFYTS